MKNPILASANATIAPRGKNLKVHRERRIKDGLAENGHVILPQDGQLAELLGFEDSSAVEAVLKSSLLGPVADMTSHPGKRIRAQLVSLCYRLLNGDRPPLLTAAERCRSCAEAVEFIHAGSLVVDDIEDGSVTRRNRPSLHVHYGIPVALNAGNWLYFWPFELLKVAGFDEEDLLRVYERCHRTLLRAHLGQALDLGARVDTLAQHEVAPVCLASMQLKTGALMGFAAFLGGVLADAPAGLLSALDDFGRDLGVALQMFDDLGNVIGKCEPSKRYEDLILSRPSWVWACAAQRSERTAYRDFVAAARKLPEAEELEAWMERHGMVGETRRSARAHLDRSFDRLKERLGAGGVRWSKGAFGELRALGEEIAVAYG